MALPPSKKARALLAYLVETRRPHGRSALCDFFWEGVDDPRAGLRWALSKLRAAVDDSGHRRIVAQRDRVEFDAERTWVDLHRARETIPDDPAGAPVGVLEEVLPTFRGEFLEDLDLPACHQYQVWCMGTRERVRRTHISVRRDLTERLRGDPDRALPHALVWLRMEPFSEEAYVAAMGVLGRLGRPDRGLELYDRCRRMLSEDLGRTPSPELEAARRGLRDPARMAAWRGRGTEESSPRAGHEADGDPAALAAILADLPAPDGLPEPGAEDPPLVARMEEMRVLARVAACGAEGDRRVLLITGEPGIGKTRLLRELIGEVRSIGGWALCGPVFESEEIRPYGPWIDLIRMLSTAVPGQVLDRDVSALLADPGSGRMVDAPLQRTRLFEAVAQLLERLTEARAPGLVVLDDLQWVDASSAALLHYVGRTLHRLPLVFALAAREEELEEGAAPARMLRSLEEEGLLRRVRLRRLDARGTESLVHAVDESADTARIFAASEGNPLFALAMARTGREGTDLPDVTIGAELSARLGRLDDHARSLLPWAAALGRAFDVPTLVRVLEKPTSEVLQAVDRLERRGILRAAGPDRYDFTHSLLRRAAHERVSVPARRAIHRSIAHALDEPDRPGERSPGPVAHHAELGGLARLGARAYTEAAEHSLWLFALDEAVEQVARGLALVESVADDDRIPLEMGLLRLYGFRSLRDRRPDDVEARVRRLTDEARERGFAEVVAVGHASLTELEYQRGAFAEAGRSSVRSADAGRESEPLAGAEALANTGACLLLLDQAPEDARRLIHEARTLAERHGLESVVIVLARALLLHHDGELDDACHTFEVSVRLGRETRDRWWEGPTLARMLMVELDRGHAERTLARAQEAERLAERLGDEPEAAFARGLRAVASERSRDGSGPEGGNDGGFETVDEALRQLRVLDSLWSIGHVQAYAAELGLERGCADVAEQRAEEVLRAARTLGRPSLLALGKSLAARSAAVAGRGAEASRHLDLSELSRPRHHLSHRARQALRRAERAVAQRS